MGKPFSHEEREQVQDILRRTGLQLLAENGIRNVSIRELTRQAGIAQGGFYTFYKNKEEFVIDLFLLRIREKTDAMLAHKEDTLADPERFVAELLYKEGMHLKENRAFNNQASGTLGFFAKYGGRAGKKSMAIYRTFLEKLIRYWEENGYTVECDVDGILNVGIMGSVLFSNAGLIDEGYFEKIYREYCRSETARFLKIKGKHQQCCKKERNPVG